MAGRHYFVYLLTNFTKTVLYTGITSTFERVQQHTHGACDRLVYFEEYGEIDQAIAREKQIKGWTRAKKNALVASTNPEWKDLAADW